MRARSQYTVKWLRLKLICYRFKTNEPMSVDSDQLWCFEGEQHQYKKNQQRKTAQRKRNRTARRSHPKPTATTHMQSGYFITKSLCFTRKATCFSHPTRLFYHSDWTLGNLSLQEIRSDSFIGGIRQQEWATWRKQRIRAFSNRRPRWKQIELSRKGHWQFAVENYSIWIWTLSSNAPKSSAASSLLGRMLVEMRTSATRNSVTLLTTKWRRAGFNRGPYGYRPTL